jgi:hypothetical protein
MSNYGNYREMAKNVRDCVYHSEVENGYVLRCLFILTDHIEACARQDGCWRGDLIDIIEYIKQHPEWED